MTIIKEHHRSIRHIHAAPPCGTCSAAREKPIPAFERLGFPSPKPLRSAQYPYGLPTLNGLDQVRVEAANTLYALVDRLVRLACALKLSISVENPANSWFWSLPVIQGMTSSVSGCFTTFDMCVHGGLRAKATTFWANSQILAGLEAKCPGNHKHDSWAARIVNGRPHYPTKAEAAYPALLCQRIAALVRHHCCPDSLPPPIHGPASSELRCAMDKQSRKAAPLVEEYSSMDLWAIPMDDPACLQQLLKIYPKGSRVTQRQLVSWGNIRAGLNPSLDSESLRNSLSSRWSWKTKGTGEAAIKKTDRRSDMDRDS